MTTTVVDSTNLEQIMAYSGIEAEPSAEVKPAADKPADGPSDKPAEKTEAKVEAKPEGEVDDADDVEDDDGTTARQKRELSAKMLKAIGKKHRQVKEAEEFAAHQYREKQAAEARAADLERQLEAAKPRPETPKEEVAPKREDFATETDYIDAKIQWGVDQGIKIRDAERAAADLKADVERQYARAVELVPDFEATVSVQRTYPPGVVAYMKESSLFAEFGYHFGKNPEVLQKLVSLSPIKQLVELGKIETTLRPFGSSAGSPKDGDKPDGNGSKPTPSAGDTTGFSPSKARSDAPVIVPLTGGEGSVEPEVRSMNIRQNIEKFQKDHKVNLHARKRH